MCTPRPAPSPPRPPEWMFEAPDPQARRYVAHLDFRFRLLLHFARLLKIAAGRHDCSACSVATVKREQHSERNETCGKSTTLGEEE
jgi:hypothetical protein